MKKWMGMGLVAVLLSGCVQQPEKTPPRSTLVVGASFYPMYVAALNIARDVPGVRVADMTQSSFGCLHDYQLTPADMKFLSRADVFVVNGGGMESFLEKALQQMPRLKIINASENIPLFKAQWHEHGNSEEDDPHVWVSVEGMMRQARNIADGFKKMDPPHADLYERNAQAYLVRLDDLRQRMKAVLSGVSKRNIVTFHEAFSYFAREFGLNVVRVISSEPNAELNSQELAEIISLIKNRKVDALFAEVAYPAKAAEVIARETGLKVYTLDVAATGPALPPEAYDAYLRAMERNLQTLQEALR
ncbi:MAG: metal ABC transporter substrate-binding protein [bacterium]